jgi:hypothetical protein
MDFGVVIERGGGVAAIERATGIRTENLYAMKSGTRNAGEKTARRIAQHVPGISTEEVMILSRASMMKRAMRDGDQVGVLKAAMAAAKLSEGHTLNAAGEKFLDELTATAVKFAENPHLLDFEDEDEEEAEQYGDDPNRDALGRAISWAGKGHEEDEPEDDFEDEEYGDDPERDHFGRYIGKEAR